MQIRIVGAELPKHCTVGLAGHMTSSNLVAMHGQAENIQVVTYVQNKNALH